MIAGLSMQPPPFSSGLFLEINVQRHSRIKFWRNQRSKRVTGEKERVSTEVLLQANRWCLHLLKRQHEGPKNPRKIRMTPLPGGFLGSFVFGQAKKTVSVCNN